jgi:hypothetical protein
MTVTTRLAALLALSSALSLAETWSGSLVDSKCYGYEEHNVNPTDTLTSVDRDQNQEIRYCSPNPKTRAFVFVQHDGTSFALDSAGNAKAAALIQATGKKHPFPVVVTGEMSKNTIKVDSVSLLR